MPIQEDHRRFRDIVKGKIKENFRKYVTHEEMIGKRENEYVRIPIPHIDIPTFRYGSKQSGGVGQGTGAPGDGVQPGDGSGKAGDTAGEHELEVELTVEELAEILGEALELPRIQPKGNKNAQVVSRKYSSLGPVGPESLRHFRASYKAALKRSISGGLYNPHDPIVIPMRGDIRYRVPKEIKKPQARAVVIYMMDISGSMGEEQKEIVRLESFWINAWLKKHYKGLETRFIVHDAQAKEVDETTFFRTSESGGTLISSAYTLCQKIIENDYPPNEWNIYPFHFSDGDNWSGEDTKICLQLIRDFFITRVNMFGYGQVESKYGSGQFYKDLEHEGFDGNILVLSKIENKNKIIDSIKDFLSKGQ